MGLLAARVGADVVVVEAAVETIPAAAAHEFAVLTRAFFEGLVCSGDALSMPGGSLLVRLRPSLTLTQQGQFFFTLVRTDDRRFVVPRSATNEKDRSIHTVSIFQVKRTYPREDRHQDRVDLRLLPSADGHNVLVGQCTLPSPSRSR